ncbi:hypothetical protein IG631_00504 [Alternaria alternata]|nr:hypothetical protein IG631_00504 [Alternaria alternata]
MSACYSNPFPYLGRLYKQMHLHGNCSGGLGRGSVCRIRWPSSPRSHVDLALHEDLALVSAMHIRELIIRWSLTAVDMTSSRRQAVAPTHKFPSRLYILPVG